VVRAVYRNLLIILVVLFIAVAAVCVSTTAYLNSHAFETLLLQRLNERIRGVASLGGHSVSLLGGRVELRQLALADAAGVSLVAIDRLQVDVDWLPLIRRCLHLHAIIVEGADLKAAFDSRDRMSLLEVFESTETTPEEQKPDGASSAWQVRLDDFRIQIARIQFQRPVSDADGQGRDLVLTGNLDTGTQTGRVRVSLGYLHWRQAERSFGADGLEVELEYDPSWPQPIKAALRTARSHLSTAARVNWSAEPLTVDAVADLDVDLSELNPWLTDGFQAVGRVRGSISARGDLFDPAVSVQLDAGPGSVAGVDIHDLNLRLGLEHRKVTITSLKSNSAWGALSATGEIDLQGLFPTDFRKTADQGLNAVTYGLTLQADALRPKQIPNYAIPLDGSWQGRISVQGNGIFGPGSIGKADLGITVSAVSAGSGAQPFDGTFDAGLLWQGRRLQLARGRAVVGENHLNLQGSVDLGDESVDVTGKLVCPRLTQVGALTGLTVPSGNAALDFTCRGALTKPLVTARLLAGDLALAPWTIGRLMVTAEMDPQGVLRISDLMLENQGSLIQGSGRLELFQSDGARRSDPGVTAALRFDQLQVSDFGPYADVTGQLGGSLAVSGTIGSPQALLTLDNSPVGWRDVSGQLQGKVRWNDGRLSVDTISLARGTSLFDVSGTLEWRDAKSGQWLTVPRIAVRAASDGIELADVHPDGGGRVTVAAALEGPANNLEGTFRIGGQALTVAGQQIAGIDLQGRLAGQRIHVDTLDLSLVEDQRLQGSGWYGFDRNFSLKLATDGLDLSHIAVLQRAYPVQGLLVLDLNGGGSVDRPDINATLSLQQPRFKDQPFDDFNASLQLAGGEMDLTADLNFHLRTHLQLDSGDYSLNAAFSRTDLTPYLALLAGPKWSGILSGTLRAAGNRHSLARSEATLALSEMKLLNNDIELVTADNMRLELNDGELNVPTARVQVLQTGYLDVSAAGPLSGDVRARADGRLPLAALAPFTDALADVGGQVMVHGHSQGPISSPVWQADLTMEQVSFDLPQLSQGVAGLNGTIHLNPESISVDNLSGTMDSGRFDLNGSVALSDFVPKEGALRLRMHRLPLQWPGTMEAVLNGDLTLQGGTQGASLAGTIVLVEGSYYKDVRLDLLSALTETKRAREVPVIREKPPWMRRIALDVQVRHRNPFLVDNNLARLEIAPDFHCGGTLARPVLSGRAEVTDGELIYRRKTFQVKRGVVDFVNPNRIEPTLDIVGEARIRQWLVTLGVTGTPDRLVLSLSSDPPEADNDILSLILIGRTNKEMIEGEGGGKTTTRQMLAQLVATAFGEDIKKTAGVDILELETGSQTGADDPNRVQVTVGKKLSRRLTVKYSVESEEGEMIQRAVSEYRFLEHVLASGFQDNKGKYGGELLYRLEFR
jgi:translocation and assembly module TamB